MKNIAYVICFIAFLFPQNARCGEIKIIDSGICEQVADHRAVNPGDVFSRHVGKLYAFTRIIGPFHEDLENHVTHVWYWGEVERARIQLPLKSSNWGTYSSKIIQRHETGDWHVELLDSHNERIAVFRFKILE